MQSEIFQAFICYNIDDYGLQLKMNALYLIKRKSENRLQAILLLIE